MARYWAVTLFDLSGDSDWHHRHYNDHDGDRHYCYDDHGDDDDHHPASVRKYSA